MIDLDKLPRNILVPVCAVLFAVCLFFTNRAVAESDKNKAMVQQAKIDSEKALETSDDLKNQIADVRGAQETFRKEYREDQKDLTKNLDEQKTLLLKISAKL